MKTVNRGLTSFPHFVFFIFISIFLAACSGAGGGGGDGGSSKEDGDLKVSAGPDLFADNPGVVEIKGDISGKKASVSKVQWAQISGPAVNLYTNTNSTAVSFIAPKVTSARNIRLRLTAVDDGGFQIYDDVIITIPPELQPPDSTPPVIDGIPMAIAKPGATVSLTVEATSTSQLNYLWYQITGPQLVNFSGGNTPTITFTAPDNPTKIWFIVRVYDDQGLDDFAGVLVEVVPNIPPVASAGGNISVVSGQEVTIIGSGSDADGMVESYNWVQISGPPVDLVFNSAQPNLSFTAPIVTATQQILLHFIVTDDLGATDIDDVVITVEPELSNIPPTANAGSDVIANPGDTIVINGSGDDVDGTIASYNWVVTGGPSGIVLNGGDTAVVSFEMPVDMQGLLSIVLQLTVTDDQGATGTDEVVIRPNVPPIANAGADQSAMVGDTVNLSGSGTDPDGTVVSYMWSQISGEPVTLVDPNSATTEFVAPNVATVITLRLKATDNHGGEDTDDVVITINDTNLPPTADAGPDLVANAGDTVTITGSGSDPDPVDTLSYQWTQEAGPTVTLSGADTDTVTFTAPQLTVSAVITLRLTVDDGNGGSGFDEVNITINGVIANNPPTADAGVDQTVAMGDLVTLTGTGSDTDGTVVSYDWMQLSGPPVAITGANLPVATFIAPQVTSVTVIEMELKVTDDGGATGTDIIVITVNPQNIPPVANAGDPQTVVPPAVVTLSGSGTDADGTVVSFQWTQLSGPNVQLTGADTDTAQFDAPDLLNVTVLTFRLTVTDNEGATGTDDVRITINGTGNELPVADAGPDVQVNSGDTVDLVGSGADTDGTIVASFWTQLRGPQVSLTNTGINSVSFVAPAVGIPTELELQYTVVDNQGGIGSDNAIITVLPTVNNAIPTANAGPNLTIDAGEAVTITGSGTDSDGVIVSYQWTEVSGVSLNLQGVDTDTVSFTAPTVATQSTATLRLTVTDDLGATGSDDVVITINPTVANIPPLADAGPDLTAFSGDLVQITGSGTDTDGSIVGYQWSYVSGPTVTLSGVNTATVSFTAPAVAQLTELVLELTVTDTVGATGTDQVVIAIDVPVNLPPVANAGPDLSVGAGDPVTITGSGEDVDGTVVSYQWQQMGGATTLALTNANTAEVSFTAPDVTATEQFILELTVTDDAGDTGTDQVQVTVSPPNANNPPVANAGVDIATIAGQPVSITGSGTDSDGTVDAYAWSQVSGPTVSLTGADTATVEFTAPDVTAVSEVVLELTVTDNVGGTGTDQVIITVNPIAANAIPTADAGPDLPVSPLDQVTLNGSGTDIDGQIAGYQWTQTGGTSVPLQNADTAVASFQAPDTTSQIELTFELTVTDDQGATDSDVMVVTVFPLTTLSGTISMAPGTMVDSDINDTSANAIFQSNDTPETAQTIVNPVSLGGYVNLPNQGRRGRTYASGDEDDYFAISMSAGQGITLFIGDVAAGANDLDLYLYDQNSVLVDSSLGAGTATESLQVPADGSYFINVKAASGASNYVLQVGVSVLVLQSNGFRLSDDFQSGDLIVRFDDSASKSGGSVKTLSNRASTLGLQGKAGAPGRDMLFALGQGAQKATAMNTLGISNARAAITRVPAALQDKLDTLLAAKALAKQSDVVEVGLNYRFYPAFEPNDTNYNLQWHLPAINLHQAWDITTGSPDVVVAVIDTGVLLNHPDLQGQLVQGYDFIADDVNSGDNEPGIDANPNDPGDGGGVNPSSFHGTHVSGTIAAATNNGIGVAGVASGAKVLPCRAVGISGGLRYDIEQCIRYAAGLPNDSGTVPAQTADIINLSLGGPSINTNPPEAYVLARQAGVIVIAAAGNNATNELFVPAAYDGVVSVSATNISRQLASYSNFGTTIDVAAPGGDSGDVNGDGFFDGVLSTSGDDTSGSVAFAYSFSAGTSMAAPHMAGVVALMKSVNPTLTPDILDQMLINGDLTDDLGSPGRDDDFGYGLINADKAVLAASNANGGTPPPPPSPPEMIITPNSLNFGTSTTNVQINLANGGGGTLTVTDITNDAAGWLSVAPATVDGDGLGIYDVNVNRAGLLDGTYSATITITSSLGTHTVSVIMQVSGVIVNDNAGVQYVELYDAETSTLFDRIIVVATDGQYNYQFVGIPLGVWNIRSGSDLDFDFNNCELGEACGAYPLLDNTISQDIIVDGSTQLIEGLDFTTGFNVNIAIP